MASLVLVGAVAIVVVGVDAVNFSCEGSDECKNIRVGREGAGANGVVGGRHEWRRTVFGRFVLDCSKFVKLSGEEGNVVFKVILSGFSYSTVSNSGIP